MNKIEEIFAPETIQTIEELMTFLIKEIEARGGDPTKIKMVNTETAIPHMKFSDEWPCWTLTYDKS